MLLTGRVNFGLIQLCLRMVPSYLHDSATLYFKVYSLSHIQAF
jgi:hypothetical protein